MKHWITQAPTPGSELQKTLMGKQWQLKTSLNDSGCPKQEGFPKSSHQQAREKFPLLKSVLFPKGEKYQSRNKNISYLLPVQQPGVTSSCRAPDQGQCVTQAVNQPTLMKHFDMCHT